MYDIIQMCYKLNVPHGDREPSSWPYDCRNPTLNILISTSLSIASFDGPWFFPTSNLHNEDSNRMSDGLVDNIEVFDLLLCHCIHGSYIDHVNPTTSAGWSLIKVNSRDGRCGLTDKLQETPGELSVIPKTASSCIAHRAVWTTK